MKKYFTILVTAISTFSIVNAQSIVCNPPFIPSNWQIIGPLEYTARSAMGKVISIWADPSNINHLLVGTGSSGLWETFDQGDNWGNVFSNTIPAIGAQNIEQVKAYIDGPDYEINSIYASTMFEGSNMSRFGIGLIYFDPHNNAWEVEPIENFPAEYRFDINTKDVGGYSLAYRGGSTYQLWVGNADKIFIRSTLSNYISPTENYYTWTETPVLDYYLDGDPSNTLHSVKEIDFSPDNTNYAIVSPLKGTDDELLFTNNAGAANPTWTSMYVPSVSLQTGETYYRLNASTHYLDNDNIYSVIEFEFYNIDSVNVRTKSYLCKYKISGSVPVLLKEYTLTGGYSSGNAYGIWKEIVVFPDNLNQIFVGDNQYSLYKGTITTSSTINLIRTSSWNPGDASDTHTDVRDIDFYYNAGSSSKILYIATDGGVSMCDQISSLSSSDNNNDGIWENINGYGFTMTEFVGFSNSEFQKYNIIASAPDGNTFIYNDFESSGTYEFRNVKKGDAYNAAIGKTLSTSTAAIHNSNGGGPYEISWFNRIDLDSGIVSFNGYMSPEIPRADYGGTPPVLDLGYNIALKPFDFEIHNGVEYFWTGTDDMFRNDKAFVPPYASSDYTQMSKAHVHNDIPASLDFQTTREISAYQLVYDKTNPDIIYMYFTTQKEMDPTNPTYPDAIKVVKAKYDPTSTPIVYSVENLTPTEILDETEMDYNQFYNSYVTDIIVDDSDPDVENTEIWVCFGAYQKIGRLLDRIMSSENNGIKGRVYYSPDDGETWYNRSEGLPDYPVICLEYWEGSDDIIFAGTNVGVYIWNKAEEIWECFDSNDQMPYASVNDLEINYCTMSLRACTQGYGLWETPLPLGTHFSRAGAPALEITSDITWTQSNDAGRDIRIKPGATLTIQDCEIRMPKEHRIIVERGAALILDNATLINYCEAWSGIEVWGNTSKPHPLVTHVLNGTYPSALDDHGVVYLKNNSKIVNAETGISTYKTTPEGNDAIYNGGIIIAEDASFINNQLAVRFMPYDYPVGSAYDTDDDNISYFKNCVFNINTEYILENNSAYQVSMWDVDGIDFLGCDFTNGLLQADVSERGEAIYSVDATYTVSNYCTDIYAPCGHYDNSQFSGFFRAIEAANTKYLPLDITITYNLFENNQRAVLLSNVDNSSVFLNSYIVPDHATNHNYGVYLEQSEGYRVEENTFSGYESLSGSAPYSTGLYVGNNSNAVTKIYKNYFHNLETGIRSQTLNKKLQIKCCTFDAIDFFNIYVTSGELDNQGKCLNASYPLSDRVQAPAGNVFSNEVDPNGDIRVLSAAEPFIYRHHIDLAPEYYQLTKVTLDQCNIYSTADVPCPSYLEGSGSAAMMMSMAGETDDAISELSLAIDGLSIYATEETVEALSEDMEILLSEKEYYTSEAVDLYITEQKTDSAIAVLQNEEAQWAKERLVEVYMLTGDYENAEAQLKTLTTDEPSTQDFITLQQVVINMRSDGRTLDSLTEKEFAIIESLQGKQSPSGVAAENILQLINKTDIPEVFDAEEAEDMRFANTETKTQISIYPNPTTGIVYVDLNKVLQIEIPILFHLYNMAGKKVIEKQLHPGGVEIIQLDFLSAGIYVLSCMQEGVLLHTEKVVVE